jgi:hypothetical protein
MVYLDFCSLCLIIAMRHLGGGSGRRLVPYSRRFKLTEPQRRHAARGPGCGSRTLICLINRVHYLKG